MARRTAGSNALVATFPVTTHVLAAAPKIAEAEEAPSVFAAAAISQGLQASGPPHDASAAAAARGRRSPNFIVGSLNQRREFSNRCVPVTPVTAASAISSYLGIIAMARLTQVQRGEHDMTKFYCLIAAAAAFFPVAMATMNQAAMIVA